MRRRLTSLALVLALTVAASSCAVYRNDRCYIDPDRYEQARLLYDKVGSIKLTEETLRQSGWRRCEINEVAYRFEKELRVGETVSP